MSDNVDYSFMHRQYVKQMSSIFKGLAERIGEIVEKDSIPSFSMIGLIHTSMKTFIEFGEELWVSSCVAYAEEENDSFWFASTLSATVNNQTEAICKPFLKLEIVDKNVDITNVTKSTFGKADLASALRGSIERYKGLTSPYLWMITPIMTELNERPGCVFKVWEENDYEQLFIEFFAGNEHIRMTIDHGVIEGENKALFNHIRT